MDTETDAGTPAARSCTVDLDGPVHHVDFGGREDGPTVVLVHGLGGSHLNWDLFAPLLTPHARVHALDLPGFGRSEPGQRTANVRDNVVVLDRFIREVTGGPVVLVGNSMGGMVSVLEAQRSPAKVSGLVLVDAALPGPRGRPDPRVAAAFGLYALPGAGARYLAGRRRRLGARGTVREMLVLCGVDPDAVPPALIDRSVALVDERRDVAGMDRAFLTAARSLLLLLADPRLIRRAMAGVQVPVLLVQGDRDRLVPVSVARDVARRHPDWRYVELAGAGHVPQLQCPELLAEHVLAWLPR
ncbi:Pimeloyl-ACP methyl ester carboxylesterase [Geodermatophilus africanus]|uniref:Pimeloyl-ACP methyl ester carboxylesterase n=1 Tax=Geodermatophilus africanus TaxID=1137993 RepID=A0A1H3QFI6_9ACTN|nr:alpha/beta hydrolase [Geodermatophilus africanus]SDZ12146.1 Pimeloyl-ACP methyl ester carboxylesterase [Geodermatophilus africanus]